MRRNALCFKGSLGSFRNVPALGLDWSTWKVVDGSLALPSKSPVLSSFWLANFLTNPLVGLVSVREAVARLCGEVRTLHHLSSDDSEPSRQVGDILEIAANRREGRHGNTSGSSHQGSSEGLRRGCSATLGDARHDCTYLE